MALPCHTLRLYWRRRKSSLNFRSLEYRGPDRDILCLLEQQQIHSFQLVEISVRKPNKVALGQDRWEVSLTADGERAVICINTGVLYVGVEPGTECQSGSVEFANPRGHVTMESADMIVGRGLALRALTDWLRGPWFDFRPGALDWDMLRNRDNR